VNLERKRRTELTSGAPPGPERPRSVLEALEGARAGIYGVAARAHVADRRGIRVDGITTTVAWVRVVSEQDVGMVTCLLLFLFIVEIAIA
jgi:hypothetical protein